MPSRVSCGAIVSASYTTPSPNALLLRRTFIKAGCYSSAHGNSGKHELLGGGLTYTVGAAGDRSAPLLEIARQQLERRAVAAVHLDVVASIMHHQPVRRLQLQHVGPRHVVERRQECGALGRDRGHHHRGRDIAQVGPVLGRRRRRRRLLCFKGAENVGAQLGRVVGGKGDAGARQRQRKR